MGGSEGRLGDGRPDDIEFLSNAAVRLAELAPTEDLFSHIANELSTLAPRAIVVTSSYDSSSGCTVVRAVAGPDEMLAAAQVILGRDPVGLTLCMVDEARAGHDVEVAYSGPEGLAKARRAVPDLVLCDIGLPGIDGYEVARNMRADPKLAETMPVAVTGYATSQDVARARAAGFDRHIAKPPSLDRVLELASSALQRPQHL